MSDLRRWIILIIVTSGIFMAMLDATIVNIVLSKMMAALNADVYSVEWVLLSFSLGATIAIASSGWLGSIIDFKYVFLSGLAIFTVMSIFCGMAPSLGVMEVVRFLQGFGSGLIITTGMTLIYSTFPKEKQGTALGFYAFGASAAPALGPTLGGIITDNLTWRWIFYINVPIGLIASIAGFYLLVKTSEEFKPARRSLDYVGFILMVVTLSSLNIFLSKGQEYNWLQSNFILYLLIIFIITIIPFILTQSLKKEPLIQLSLLKIPSFRCCFIIMGGYALVRFGVWVLIPLYMQNLRMYPTLTIGLILLPGSIAGAIGSILGGYLSDRWNPKWMLIIGLVGGIFTTATFHTGVATSKYVIAWDYTKWMFFSAIVFSPLLKLALGDLPQKFANMGTTVIMVSRLVFGSVGISIAVAIATRKGDVIYDALASKVTYGSIYMRRFLAENLGNSGMEWLGKPFSTWKAQMQLFIENHAYSYSYENTLTLMSILAALIVIPALFLKYETKRQE